MDRCCDSPLRLGGGSDDSSRLACRLLEDIQSADDIQGWTCQQSSFIPISAGIRCDPLEEGQHQRNLLGYDLWWLIFTYITDGTFVKTETFVVPLKRETSVTDIDNYIGNPTGTEKGVLSITLNDVVDGNWDELLKLQPIKIKGAWLVPIDPGTVSGSGTENDPFRLQGWQPYKINDGLSSFKRATNVGELPEFPEMEIPFDTVSTSDIRKLVVTGMDGETVGEVPWGLGLSSLKYRIVISAASCYIQIRTGIDGHSEGTCYSIPAIVLDTIENAWSEYNYSGQRAYDMNSRSLQAQQKLIGSLTTGVLGGGLAGATQQGKSAASIPTLRLHGRRLPWARSHPRHSTSRAPAMMRYSRVRLPVSSAWWLTMRPSPRDPPFSRGMEWSSIKQSLTVNLSSMQADHYRSPI